MIWQIRNIISQNCILRACSIVEMKNKTKNYQFFIHYGVTQISQKLEGDQHCKRKRALSDILLQGKSAFQVSARTQE